MISIVLVSSTLLFYQCLLNLDLVLVRYSFRITIKMGLGFSLRNRLRV